MEEVQMANRSFLSSKNPHFKNEAKGRTLLFKISFTCKRILRSFSYQQLGTYPRFAYSYPIVAASQPRTARQCNFRALLGSGDQAVICKLHDRQFDGQRLLRSLVQRWILVFLDKFIIGSQGISLSFVCSFIWFIISPVVIFQLSLYSYLFTQYISRRM